MEAIYYTTHLPEQWKHYAQVNADFFHGLVGEINGRYTCKDTIDDILRGEAAGVATLRVSPRPALGHDERYGVEDAWLPATFAVFVILLGRNVF